MSEQDDLFGDAIVADKQAAEPANKAKTSGNRGKDSAGKKAGASSGG